MTILEEFNHNKSDYIEFCDKLSQLIISVLKSEGITPHQITTRVKDHESLKRKLESKHGKYTDISDITDIVGIRIITYFEDEVDSVAKIIQKEFSIDPDNSIDKRNGDLDRFGYKSLHYVIKLNNIRGKLSEYKKFKKQKAEIQLRSILQHSWAEIEHDLGYKSQLVIPDVAKRSFYRISALLEVADIEFVNLKNLLTTYKEEVRTQISKSPSQFNLDQDTLIEFTSSNPLFKQIQEKIGLATKMPITGIYGNLSIPITTYKQYGINTIEDLTNYLKKYEKQIVQYEKYTAKGYSGLGKATPLHTLAAILQVENDNKTLYEGSYGDDTTFEEAKKIFSRAKKIN